MNTSTLHSLTYIFSSFTQQEWVVDRRENQITYSNNNNHFEDEKADCEKSITCSTLSKIKVFEINLKSCPGPQNLLLYGKGGCNSLPGKKN